MNHPAKDLLRSSLVAREAWKEVVIAFLFLFFFFFFSFFVFFSLLERNLRSMFGWVSDMYKQCKIREKVTVFR